MKVGQNGHHITDDNGTPFFWLGDTCWPLFVKPSLEEVALYLDNRRRKGFNVVQCVLAGFDRGRTEPNSGGERPWCDDDPAKPNDAYFRHVDTILDMAAQKGLFLAMLPAWGNAVTGDKTRGPLISAANARAYGRWLGTRYAERDNVFWVLGGDRKPTENGDYLAVFDELAAGLEEGDGHSHLKTYHPRPGTSSEWFHDRAWLDFNMQQTGTLWDRANYEWILADYNRQPPKPVVDGEARYENSHMLFGKRPPVGPIVTAHQVRKAAYNAVLSGAMGHTYGCRDVWSFHVPGQPVSRDVRLHWREAMDLPGAFHMGHLRDLMHRRPWHRLVPDQAGKLVVAGSCGGGVHVPAARAEDGSFAYAYVPEHQAIAVDMGRLSGADGVAAAWFDPRTGQSAALGQFPAAGIQAFTTPAGGADPDYVLTLEA